MLARTTRWLLLVALSAAVSAPAAEARPPVPGPVFKAVRAYWHTPAEREKAFDVVACETGDQYNTTATNGQYENIFQMGYSERKRFGWHVAGDPAWKAARAARAYYDYRRRRGQWGWGAWSCA